MVIRTIKYYFPILLALIVVLAIVGFAGYKLYFEETGWPTSSHFDLLEDPTTINWKFDAVTKDATSAEERIKQISGDSTIGDYEKDLSLAEEYRLLGEGDLTYKYLLKAIDVLPNKSLTYGNLGDLLEKVGAIDSARGAYERAVTVESQYPVNHSNLIQFYIRNYSDDTDLIKSTFESALDRTGKDETLMKEFAQWLSSQKQYSESVAIWQKVLKNYHPQNQQAIEQEIARLQKLNK